MGMVYGDWHSSPHPLEPGGLSYEASLMAHGGKPLGTIIPIFFNKQLESIERWREATALPLEPTRVFANSIGDHPASDMSTKVNTTVAFMFHIPAHVAITDYALIN